MLQRLRVKNFKLLRDVELELSDSGPTVLIGPNASGKSTIIEVLDFLARCATEGVEPALIAHGGVAAIRTASSTAPIEIDSSWAFSHPDINQSYSPDREWHIQWVVSINTVSNGRPIVDAERTRSSRSSKPLAWPSGGSTAVAELENMKIVREITGKKRDRVYIYGAYITMLNSDVR